MSVCFVVYKRGGEGVRWPKLWPVGRSQFLLLSFFFGRK